jgi:prepilin-type processing-associated H-X9-DG protein
VVPSRGPNPDPVGDISAFVSLLPYLEQPALFNSVNFAFGQYESAETPTVENHTVRQTLVDVFLCPSDGEPNRRVNYRFNRGRRDLHHPKEPPYSDGPFSVWVVPSATTITDGLSQTAFVSERIAGNFILDSADRQRNVKCTDQGGTGSDDEFIPICLATQPDVWMATSGRYRFYTGYGNTHYNHNGVPNDPRPSCGSVTLLTGYDCPDLGLHPPRSFHPGCVNVLFGDGHVEAISNSVSERVWTKIGTYNAGD